MAKKTLQEVKQMLAEGWIFSKNGFFTAGGKRLRDTLYEATHDATPQHPHVTFFVVDVTEEAHQYLQRQEEHQLKEWLWIWWNDFRSVLMSNLREGNEPNLSEQLAWVYLREVVPPAMLREAEQYVGEQLYYAKEHDEELIDAYAQSPVPEPF